MEHDQVTIMPWFIINAPWPCGSVELVEVIFAVGDMYALVAIAIVELFKQEPMYGLTTVTKISDHCREVAKSGQVPLQFEWRSPVLILFFPL